MPNPAASTTLQALLQRRERLFRVKVAAMLAFGLPLSLLGAALLATMFWFAAWRGFEFWLPWWQYFAVLAVITVPLLYRLELQTAGRYLSQTITEPAHDFGRGAMSIPHAGGWLALASITANSAQLAGGLVEIFLFGPRMVVGALRQLRFLSQLGPIERSRAAQVVAALFRHDGGLEIAKLYSGGGTVGELVPILAWLIVHRWIGVREAGDRAWLLSEAREAIQRAAQRAQPA